MDKKEFILDDEDFNYGLLLTHSKNIIVQLVDGKLKWVSKETLAGEFWKRMAIKYGFVIETVEENLPGRDSRYFLAVPFEILNYHCTLCNRDAGPDTDHGCDKASNPSCAWHNK